MVWSLIDRGQSANHGFVPMATTLKDVDLLEGGEEVGDVFFVDTIVKNGVAVIDHAANEVFGFQDSRFLGRSIDVPLQRLFELETL
ncbi:hypothetical protein M3Y96_01215400 [Aphelenchoides besseyi]|nr:hypothetical protein M3Y96_01215400 [Aphelenchoides besseyi]